MSRSALVRTNTALLLAVTLAFSVARPLAAQAPSSGLSVTLADNNSTISLKPGDRFLLNLGESYTWSAVEIADQSIVSRVPGITVIRGAQGIYEAHQPGSTKLTATGDPACRQTTPPCAAPSILFSITINVGGTASTPTATPTALPTPTAPVTSPSPVASTAPKPPSVGSGVSDDRTTGIAASAGFAFAAILAAGLLLVLVHRD